MPRYYFHYFRAEDEVVEDHVGSVHGSLTEVEREARSIACEILADELAEGLPVFVPRCLEIADESGEIALYLPFWAAMRSGRQQSRAG